MLTVQSPYKHFICNRVNISDINQPLGTRYNEEEISRPHLNANFGT